jgi:hypothetical protein
MMSDFSELCPLFNTGVFSEILFPGIRMTDVTLCGNALDHTLTASSIGDFTFGRTVVVTGAYIRKVASAAVAMGLQLQHKTSRLAIGTTFGTQVVSNSITGMAVGQTWVGMTVTDTTFTSSEVLGLTVAVGTAASGGIFDMIVRYKEK